LDVVTSTDVLYSLHFAIHELLAASKLSLEAQILANLDNRSRCYGSYTHHPVRLMVSAAAADADADADADCCERKTLLYVFVLFDKMLVSGRTYF
jgi:hypothetical protein